MTRITAVSLRLTMTVTVIASLVITVVRCRCQPPRPHLPRLSVRRARPRSWRWRVCLRP